MSHQAIHYLLTATLPAASVILAHNQCRKPAGWPGRFFLWMMNARHSAVTDWGLTQVSVAPNFTILDVGCGGGRTIRKLAAAASSGKVYGIDYSAASVAAARRTNARLIEQHRVEIQQGSVSQLPFPESMFDLVSAVETHYYWPNLVADLREIRRVLKPDGQFVLIAETYKGSRFDALHQRAMALLGATYLTVDEHRQQLIAAGFTDVTVLEERAKSWICAIGRRPAVQDYYMPAT